MLLVHRGVVKWNVEVGAGIKFGISDFELLFSYE